MNDRRCTHCGLIGLQPGFILDSGQYSQGYTRWVEGFLERGFLGAAKTKGRRKWQIDVYRCPRCLHLEMFAQNQS